LGGYYGDLRNPGDAGQGWLAENFGVRFRFNAIDCLQGASDVIPPAASEQITKNVRGILMAASSTLAIVDPTKAKGLVYLKDTDPAHGWSGAIEGHNRGLYFGGRHEGPLVAISKRHGGKAAFIGDSSPIEDSSPKYRNELNGGLKRLHDGWNEPGNAATLCVNVVNWLASPEPYDHFDGTNGHPTGTVTPDPMAPVELDDPADGEPWRSWPPGYDPWNTDTFAPGSFGAPLPASGHGEDGGSGGGANTELTVSEALSLSAGSVATVVGIIQGELNDQYGLKLADSLSASQFLAVQLPKDKRQSFSPHLTPSVLGKEVRITAKRGRYTGVPGLREVKSIAIGGGK
jgi:hypothetical protein